MLCAARSLKTNIRPSLSSMLSLEEYADLVVDFLERLSPDIFVERLFGTAPKDQLIGPVWGKSKAEIQRVIEQKLLARNTWQGRKAVVSRQTTASTD